MDAPHDRASTDGPAGRRRPRLAGWRRVLAGTAAVVIGGGVAPLAVAGVAGAAGLTLYVSPSGSDTNSCTTSVTACATLEGALGKAAPTGTITVASGTYKETPANPNLVKSTLANLTIKGTTGSVITATGSTFGLLVEASGVTVTGLTFEHALMSGIRVSQYATTSPAKFSTAPPAHVTLSSDTVVTNDRCTAQPTVASCKAAVAATPHADYGEGIHLETVATSTVTGSTVKGNAGGILLTDEHGPTHADTISTNNVVDNSPDCGITLASHSATAVSTSGATQGKPQPTKAGVFGNIVSGNVSSNNGDSGVLLAAARSGGGTYTNTVSNNTLASNGHAGVTVHSHAPFQDVDNNKITGNHLSADALDGDSSVSLTQTAAIVIYTGVGAVTGTTVTGNTISHVFFGVWMSSPSLVAKTTTITGNSVSVTPGGSATYTQPDPATGYLEAGADGAVYPFGAAMAAGSMAGTPLAAPVVGVATTPDKGGYWLAASDGGIFTFGDANFYGSMGGKVLNAPIVGIAATADGKGYWEVASDGGIFTFGDANFYGSMGGKPLNKPIVGMAASPTGKGYWEVASDGGIFSFGTLAFYGSMGGKTLNKPVVGMAAAPTGKGYWEVASDGGIFTFGTTAAFHGSMGGKPLYKPIVGMAAAPTGKGYWEVASDGGIFTFGTLAFYGSKGGMPLSGSVVGVAQV